MVVTDGDIENSEYAVPRKNWIYLEIIDKILKITNKDIEDAVIEGARTLQDVQERTKVGMQDKNCIPEVEKLIEYYIKKHFSDNPACATDNVCD